MILPDSDALLPEWAEARIQECRNTVSARSNMARSLRTWRYNGSPDGNTAILNRLNHCVDRMASYLFSPTNLRFFMDADNTYPRDTLAMMEMSAKLLTRDFSRHKIDLTFARGVDIALTYGAAIPKLAWGAQGLGCNLVMPWQFGVYQENKIGLHAQEAMCETNWITPTELWRRISHLPNAMDMFKRARDYAGSGDGVIDSELGYFHQVLIAHSAPSVQTEMPYSTTTGGIVSLAADPGGGVLAPEVASKLMAFHELWVRNDETSDWTTIQMVAPDILIAPTTKRSNMFLPARPEDNVPGRHPYTLIQPNEFEGYFWGRTEMADLLKLQHMLKDRLEDLKKIMGLQYDRLLAFVGGMGITEDMYDQFRQSGYLGLEAGSDVKDLTPEVPKEAFADIKQILSFMDEVSGFTPALSGEVMPGVRSDSQTQTLMRNASPRMRDRALIVERQAADLGNLAMELKIAKDPRDYTTAGDKPSVFKLINLPADRQITVDSHSSSPIYEEDNMQKVGFLAKTGAIGPEELIDAMNMPEGERWKENLRTRQAAAAAQSEQLKQTNPEEWAKLQAKKK